MTPREELKQAVWGAIASDVLSLKAKGERIMAHTDTLAIGKWVSVDERLPEERADWEYITKWTDGEHRPSGYLNGQWDLSRFDATVIEWLDLSLPESGGGE